jgi:hypothetical protein
MSQYMLLLYDSPVDWQKASPEELQKAIEKYMAWTRMPFTRYSQRLKAEPGRVIKKGSDGKPHATDGPYTESKEVLGGLYVIEAGSYEEAVKLSLSHPHVDYGGAVVVRQVHEM